jgi:hypothetical protein
MHQYSGHKGPAHRQSGPRLLYVRGMVKMRSLAPAQQERHWKMRSLAPA